MLLRDGRMRVESWARERSVSWGAAQREEDMWSAPYPFKEEQEPTQGREEMRVVSSAEKTEERAQTFVYIGQLLCSATGRPEYTSLGMPKHRDT